MAKRAVLLIIDSFGIGALPDAHLYGDVGSNTILHICQNVDSVKWPNLQKLGLGNCSEILQNPLPGCPAESSPLAHYGVMQEISSGKDTTTGHWELAGINLETPFHTFPLEYPSFPPSLISALEQKTGHKIIGNKGASGTAIISELGERHLQGDGIICYTSADSVFQIAAHEEVVPLAELYDICTTARELCNTYNVGRVIARPFIGSTGDFKRTKNRRDFSMLPTGETILTMLQDHDIETIAIGKIGDIFCEEGITISYHDAGNEACLKRTLACISDTSEKDQFLFVNLVDTDMNFGHRRDIKGYHDAVAKIDATLPIIMEKLAEGDILIISADHGCDPAFKGTEHTREYVPLLVYEKGQTVVKNLMIRSSFSDVAQSLAFFFGVGVMGHGKTFL